MSDVPEQEKEACLWKTLYLYTSMVDVFIARKRNVIGKRFGFVRFIGVKYIYNTLSRLNGIWLGSFRMRSISARYRRKNNETMRIESK